MVAREEVEKAMQAKDTAQLEYLKSQLEGSLRPEPWKLAGKEAEEYLKKVALVEEIEEAQEQI